MKYHSSAECLHLLFEFAPRLEPANAFPIPKCAATTGGAVGTAAGAATIQGEGFLLIVARPTCRFGISPACHGHFDATGRYSARCERNFCCSERICMER